MVLKEDYDDDRGSLNRVVGGGTPYSLDADAWGVIGYLFATMGNVSPTTSPRNSAITRIAASIAHDARKRANQEPRVEKPVCR